MRSARLSFYAAAGGVSVLLAAGCGILKPPPSDGAEPADASDSPASEPAAEGASPTSEASEAGGICKYLDFESISAATEKSFSVAEAGGADEVTSCVLLTTTGKLPEVTLTRAKTETDADTYQDEIPPKGADEVDDLGKSAYSAVRESEEKLGPAVEIGWLANGHMYSLRYTTPLDTDKDEPAGTVDALIEVAKVVADAAAKDDKKEDDD